MITKLHACTLMAGEHQTHDYYMNIGPTFSDPIARQLYAEIASIEEQHVTQYESIIDATETWLEKWLLHEATEVYNYFSCVEYESNPHIKRIWERSTMSSGTCGSSRIFEQTERRDAAEVLSASLPQPIYESHRNFVRQVLQTEVNLTAVGREFVDRSRESEHTRDYRTHMNADGSPSWPPATSGGPGPSW